MILYPTDTIYGIGVNALDADELRKLYDLKDREDRKAVSWLVRDVTDIERYAVMSAAAKKLAAAFLPGPLTLVLPLRSEIDAPLVAADRTVGFRISADSVAQQVVADFMLKNKAPLTCTSANISGKMTHPTVPQILEQFGDRAQAFNEIYDDGPREGVGSMVVRVIGDEVTILREGVLRTSDIMLVLDGADY